MENQMQTTTLLAEEFMPEKEEMHSGMLLKNCSG